MFRGINPDNYFAASDFTPEGRTLEIKRVESTEVEHSKSKLVVFFKDETKGLMLNEVNKQIIIKNTGQDDTNNWVGYHITPYSTSILMKDEEIPCLRIKINVGSLAFKA